MITQSVLKEFLHYDESTGEFRWIKKASDKTEVGSVAGWLRSEKGYRQIGFMGTTFYAHRLAWMYVHGDFPKSQIDHANGIKDDNRLVNLRCATSTLNLANIGPKRDNTSGAKNVHWCNSKSRWIAKIKVEGDTKHLGSFKDFDAATVAAKDGRILAFGEFANHGAAIV